MPETIENSELAEIWISGEDLRQAAADGYNGRAAASKKSNITNSFTKVIGHQFRYSLDRDVSRRIHDERCGCGVKSDVGDDGKAIVRIDRLRDALPRLESDRLISPKGREAVESACERLIQILPAIAELVSAQEDPTELDAVE